jgi:hypothetical protein
MRQVSTPALNTSSPDISGRCALRPAGHRGGQPGLPARGCLSGSSRQNRCKDFINHLSQPARALQPTPTGSEEGGILMADGTQRRVSITSGSRSGSGDSRRDCRLVLPACQGLGRSGESTVEVRRQIDDKERTVRTPGQGDLLGEVARFRHGPLRHRGSSRARDPPRNSCAAAGADRSNESRTGDSAHPSTCAHGGTWR